MKLDVSSLQSVRDFAQEFLQNETRLNVLIHNAGYANTFRKALSVDGIELTMATNHFGPFLLTHLLIELIKKSAPSRIIIVASSVYRLVSVDLENLNPVDSIPWYLYYVSKACNIMFASELSKRLEGTNVTVNCLHPGDVDTGIWRNVATILKPGFYVWSKLRFITPVEGAKTTVYLATSDEVEGISGKYFKHCKEVWIRDDAKDPVTCLRLWLESEKMVKLQPSDPQIDARSFAKF